jgi:hypothetical protein
LSFHKHGIQLKSPVLVKSSNERQGKMWLEEKKEGEEDNDDGDGSSPSSSSSSDLQLVFEADEEWLWRKTPKEVVCTLL